MSRIRRSIVIWFTGALFLAAFLAQQSGEYWLAQSGGSGWCCVTVGTSCTAMSLNECANGGLVYDSDNATCNRACGVNLSACGNNILNAGEACDDGNTQSNDGCSASCAVEDGWQCSSGGGSSAPAPTPTAACPAANVLGQRDFTSKNMATTQAGMASPVGLAYDSAKNRLFAADPYNSRILVYDAAAIANGEPAVHVLGRPDFTSGKRYVTEGGTTSIQLPKAGDIGPMGVAYDGGNRRLFVTDYENARILVYDLSDGITDGMQATHVLGQPDFTSTGGLPTTTDAEVARARLSHPYDVAYNGASNRLFVSDSIYNRVLVYDFSDGITNGMKAVNVLGQPDFVSIAPVFTPSAGRMYGPGGLSYDSANSRLFVSDFNNGRVLVYDLSGGITDGMNATYVLGQPDFTSKTFATTQAGMGNMGGPHDLEYDSDHSQLFVADGNNARVLMYDVAAITNGEPAVAVLGQTGFTTKTLATTQAGMWVPVGLAYDGANKRLFVADNPNNRVMVYAVPCAAP